MKKICFITTISVTLRSFVLETAKYLHNYGGFDITFICNPDENFEKELPNYIHFIPVKMKRGIGLDGLKVMLRLKNIFKNEKFDLIQYSTPNAAFYSSIAGKIAKIKVRLYCQWGIRYVGFSGIKRKIFKLIEKITCNNSTWIEPDSFGNLKFSHKEKLYSAEKSSVVWNGSASGVNLEKYDIKQKEKWRKEIREKYKINNEIVIGFVGRLEKDKGVNELFEAFKNLENKNLKLMMVGPVDKPDTINKELYEWAINSENIIFTDRVKDTEKYYSAMDIFVLPSYREGFGSVVVEAEAMGVPVIVTNIPGPTDAMLKNKTGLVVDAANSKSLQLTIKKLVEDDKKRVEMAKNSVEYARNNFDFKELAKLIVNDRKKMINVAKNIKTQ